MVIPSNSNPSRAVLAFLYILLISLILWEGEGNLIYRKTARNFNPMMASAWKITIAEVEELVEPGELEIEMIHTPGIFVQRIFKGTNFEKRIEFATTREA